jgi:Raf kinase inhibitor-like YbhB/YbcL family protein
MTLALATAGLAAFALPGPGIAQEKLEVTVGGVENGVIGDKYAFCIPNEAEHIGPGENISPAISWSPGPEGTQSYAILVVDPDVPGESAMASFNKEGETIAESAERQDFYHWVLVDIPADTTSFEEGADSTERKVGGKEPGETDHGVRGINDYSVFMSGDMAGEYGGYDGPCPPWNDERVHHYNFRVYALDAPSLGLSGSFSAQEALAAMEGHVLAQGEAVGTYTLNPELR